MPSALAALRALIAVLTLAACAREEDAQPIAAQSPSLPAQQRFLVVYRALAVPDGAGREITAAGGELLAAYAEIGVAVVRASSPHFRERLRASRQVASVEASATAKLDALATHSSAWATAAPPVARAAGASLSALQWNMRQIRAREAHAITRGEKSVVVGVLDSGIDDKLPDLAGQVDPARSVTCIGGVPDQTRERWSYDAIGHGSHVAGIIAAKDDGRGTVGVAPGVTLAAVKLTEDGFVYPEAFVCGLYWAATHGFDLVNASLFVDPWYYHCASDPTQRALLVAQQRALAFARERGVTVIAAASNEQQDLAHKHVDRFSPTDRELLARAVDDSCALVPVELEGVIGVSALDGRQNLASYSNYGLGVIDLAAPGGDFHVGVAGNRSGQIVSPVPAYSYYFQRAGGWNGRIALGCAGARAPNDPAVDPASCVETYALLQGTSQAAPHVTGVAALALSRFGKLSSSELLARLRRGANHLPCPKREHAPYPDELDTVRCEGTRTHNGFFGGGAVDALATLR